MTRKIPRVESTKITFVAGRLFVTDVAMGGVTEGRSDEGTQDETTVDEEGQEEA